jgi:hypothetical protein
VNNYYEEGYSLDHRLCLSRIHRMEIELGIIPPDPPSPRWVEGANGERVDIQTFGQSTAYGLMDVREAEYDYPQPDRIKK